MASIHRSNSSPPLLSSPVQPKQPAPPDSPPQELQSISSVHPTDEPPTPVSRLSQEPERPASTASQQQQRQSASSASSHHRQPEQPYLDTPVNPSITPCSDSQPKRSVGLTRDESSSNTRTPLVLRRIALLLFMFSSVVVAVALAILFSVSERNNGLATLDERYYSSPLERSSPSAAYYGWKYGPTAIFTLFAVYWGQLEYQVKRIAPWQQMTDRPSHLEENIFLDYVSPFGPVTLFNSLKASHFSVSAVAAGAILIKLMTILSTGLFDVTNTRMEDNAATLVTTDEFIPNGIGLDMVDERAAIFVNNYFAFGASLPFGTTEEYAYQILEPATGTHTSFFAGNVSTFHADLECETATVSTQGSGTGEDYHREVLLTAPSCNTTIDILEHCLNPYSWSTDYCDGFFECNADDPSSKSEADARFYFFVGESQEGLPRLERFTRSFALICKPQYRIQPMMVSMTPESISRDGPDQIAPTADTEAKIGPDISAATFGEAVFSTLSFAKDVLILNESLSLALFGMLPTVLPQTNWTSTLMDIDNYNKSMIEGALDKVHTLVSAQVAKTYFMAPSQHTITGTAISDIPRLFIRAPAFWAVEGLLFFCLTLSLALLSRQDSRSPAPDSGSISCLARSLASKPSLTTVLSGTGALGLDDLREVVAHSLVRSSGGNISVTCKNATERASNLDAGSQSNKKEDNWYRPLTFTWYARTIPVGLLLSIIAAFEATYRVSVANNGIADIGPEKLIHYAWNYIPALVVATAGTYCSTLDFSVRQLAPYYLLRDKTIPASLLSEDFLGRTSLHAAGSAARKRQFAIFTSSTATILTPFLTIIVAGVFSPREVPQYTAISLSQIDEFSPAKKSSLEMETFTPSTMGDPHHGLTTAARILTMNLSYPMWTHDVFAFPELGSLLQTDGTGSSVNQTDKPLRARIPATRAIANCSLMPETIDDSITTNHTRLEQVIQWYVPNTTEPFPSTKDENYHYFQGNSESLSSIQSPTGTSYFGYWYTNELTYDKPTFHSILSPFNSKLPDDFPRALAVFGEAQDNITTSVTTLYCKPYLEQVVTEAQFTLPGFSLDLSFPPRADTLTRTVFSQDSYTQSRITEGLYESPTLKKLASERFADLSAFPLHVVYGLGGTPITQLVGSENVDNLAAAIDHTYGLYMAQILNTQRKRLPAPLPLNATLIDRSRLRLQQDRISTRVLQALLAAVTVLTVVTNFLVDSRRVLPKNPGSIAAFASLVVDSAWLSVIKRRLERLEDRDKMTEKEMETTVMEGLVLSMGWWGGPGSRRFGIDIGRADADET